MAQAGGGRQIERGKSKLIDFGPVRRLQAGDLGGNRFGDSGQHSHWWPRDYGVASASQIRVYTPDGTYTNHLPSPSHPSQRGAIARRLEWMGYGAWDE